MVGETTLCPVIYAAGGLSLIPINALPLLSFILLFAMSPNAQVSRPVELPDTPAGHRVAAYLKAFNTGERAMRDFIADNVAAASLQQRPIEPRIEFYRRMREEMGAIEVRRVSRAKENAITLLARTSNGEWFEFGFEFETAPPNKILSLRVENSEPAEAPTEKENPPPATMTEAQMLDALDKHMTQVVSVDEFSGTVLVAKNGAPVFQKAYGLASKEYNVPNKLDTKFNLGSINKIFTQIAIGQLAEQGKLSFDDKLGRHLPDYPNRDAAEKVTIRQLLEMKAGIGDFFGPEYEAMPKDRLRTVKDFLPLFASKPLQFEPGTKQQYSNGGYIVLGAIVEKASGQDYYDYVREHIFKPAEMQNTDSYEADAATPNLASGYTTVGGNKSARRNNFFTRPAKGSPAGGGYSTAPDLLKFVAALREGKLRAPDFRNQQKSSDPKGARFGGFGIAGGAPGINAALEADEERGYTIVVMSNYDPPSAEKVARQIRGWLGRMKN